MGTKMYPHDFVWGTQERRELPDPPGMFLVDAAGCAMRWMARRTSGARTHRG